MGQKLLGAPIGTGGVEVPNAGLVGSVKDLVGSSFQGLHASRAAEVLVPSQIDVPGAAEGGEAQPDGRHHEAGRSERPSFERTIRYCSWNGSAASERCLVRNR